MKRIQKPTVKGWAYLTLWLSSLCILNPLETSAHSLVLSICELKYENNAWTLHFKQKTRPLRDAIFSEKPELKGSNLNSREFLEETSRYIAKHFTLSHQHNLLQLAPKHMKFNGRQFEGAFLVEGMPQDPEYLTIQTSGYDAHDNSMKILNIQVGNQEYLYDFNAMHKEIMFSFDSKEFVSSIQPTPPRPSSFNYYALLGLCILLITSSLFFRNLYKI